MSFIGHNAKLTYLNYGFDY